MTTRQRAVDPARVPPPSGTGRARSPPGHQPRPSETVPLNDSLSRRRFLGASSLAGAATALRFSPLAALSGGLGSVLAQDTALKPALLGGPPVRTSPFPTWPRVDAGDEAALREVLHSGRWFRGDGQQVTQFEHAYAALTGAKYCVATANGTSALLASLAALDIGPGDEVILPPYTFVATLNVILLQYALPVFVDTDLETFQLDARKIESALTERTAAVLPVHLGGSAADLDTILEVAQRRRLPVIEDACQAHLAEWRGRKVGTWGATGCFSFQASKNLNSGEGGAILTNDEALADKCYGFHNHGRNRAATSRFHLAGSRAANLRLTEFQAALLRSQMTRVEAQSRTRADNAAYLTGLLRQIPGITPARLYDGCTRNAYHLYMFRYDDGPFAGLSRARFLAALSAEGIPCSGGYTPLNREPTLKATFTTRAYRRLYAPEVLQQCEERNQCPVNDRLCTQAVWFVQTMFLGDHRDMDDIAAAIQKIQRRAPELARA